MTTEPAQVTHRPGPSVLARAALASLALGLAAVVVGALAQGSPAAYAAAVGTLVVVGVFGFGSFVVDTVATLMPTAALLVALLTYTLQVVAMGLVFVALSGSGLLGDELDREWLAGTVIAGTAAWVVCQIALTMRARIPIYDLPEAGKS
jgi:ATP synthase protein I